MKNTLLSAAIVIAVVASLSASEKYVYPGGLNQPIQHWSYPDYITMTTDDGFFSQDINKIAFQQVNPSFWFLNGTGADWRWFAGYPFVYQPNVPRIVCSEELQLLGPLTVAAGSAVIIAPNGDISGRIKPRVLSTSSTTSLTVNSDTTDLQNVTALAIGMTVNTPTGSPVDGQLLKFFIKDNGTGRTLTWGAIFHNSPPANTTANLTMQLWFQYNATTTSWDKVIQQNF